MAVDPNLSEEQKRRLRELRAAGTPPPWARPVTTRPNGLSRAYEVGQGFAEDRMAEATPPTRPQVQLIDPAVRNLDNAVDRRQAGLTRIYKTRDAAGNSVYTDQAYLDATGAQAPAGAETRYYGVMGDRIQGTQEDLYRGADTQRRTLGRQLADAKAIREGNDPSNPNDYQWVPDPNNPGSNTVMSRAEREAADPKLAAARAAGSPDLLEALKFQYQQTRDAEAAADRRAGLDLQREGLRRQERDQLSKLSRNEDGSVNPAFLREELGQLQGLPPEDLDAYFQTERGRYTQAVLNEALTDAYKNNAASFGGGPFLDSPGNFGELEPASFWTTGLANSDRFVTPGDRGQFGISADDIGLSEADLRMLMEYYGRNNALSDRE